MSTENAFDAFADENLASTGGLWDGKTVTITNAFTRTHLMEKKDANGVLQPFIDARTGKQGVRNELVVIGIAEGEEKEREESYSAGALLPTEDGDGFRTADGRPVKLYPQAELTKFGRSIREGGFDTTKFVVAGDTIRGFKQLVGNRFVFAGVQQLDANKKPKKNSKGYDVLKFYPRQYVGSAAVNGGAPATDELRGKASAAVVDALKAAGGTMTRADLVRTLSTKLNGSADTNAIVNLVIRDEFHQGQPWVREGTTFRLSA